ncbi:MAG: hypothetical protein Q8M31_16955 [Beijerinckiaceae bacterium]|nr:hypothetical protein [Beijerinckiaceae bacterium]
MSSPDRSSAKRTTAGAKLAKTSSAKTASVKVAPKARAAPSVANEPSPQEKADFVKAMSKGIQPNTEAARKVDAKKRAAPAQSEPAETVKILRKIPAPGAVVNTAASEEALRVAAMIEKALADGDLNCLQPHAQQALIGALCKLYAANSEVGNRFPVVGGRTAVTATDVMVMCGALLKAVDLQVFELGMWQSWSSN